MYEAVIPKNTVIPSELISWKLVKERRKNENAVDAQDKKTASLDFSHPFARKIE